MGRRTASSGPRQHPEDRVPSAPRPSPALDGAQRRVDTGDARGRVVSATWSSQRVRREASRGPGWCRRTGCRALRGCARRGTALNIARIRATVPLAGCCLARRGRHRYRRARGVARSRTTPRETARSVALTWTATPEPGAKRAAAVLASDSASSRRPGRLPRGPGAERATAVPDLARRRGVARTRAAPRRHITALLTVMSAHSSVTSTRTAVLK